MFDKPQFKNVRRQFCCIALLTVPYMQYIDYLFESNKLKTYKPDVSKPRFEIHVQFENCTLPKKPMFIVLAKPPWPDYGQSNRTNKSCKHRSNLVLRFD